MTLFCLRKIIKMLVTRCQMFKLKCTKFDPNPIPNPVQELTVQEVS